MPGHVRTLCGTLWYGDQPNAHLYTSTQKHIAGSISEAAMGGAGADNAQFCVLMSLKRRARAAPERVARP
jgi:hypothetical protein